MSIQRTLILIKPDAVQRCLMGEILSRFERKGLTLVGCKLQKATDAQGREHYVEHASKPFFGGLLAFITSGPLLALVLEGDEAVAVCRNLIGATDGRKAAPGTIRGDFGISRSSNLVHGSDSEESAQREMKIWFGEGLVEWQRCDLPWLDSE